MNYIQTLGRELVQTPVGAGNSGILGYFAGAVEIRIAECGHLHVIQLLQGPQMVLTDIADPYQPHAEFIIHFLLMDPVSSRRLSAAPGSSHRRMASIA
jgi:hypothetical protein